VDSLLELGRHVSDKVEEEDKFADNNTSLPNEYQCLYFTHDMNVREVAAVAWNKDLQSDQIPEFRPDALHTIQLIPQRNSI
jgi:hypothetical protein